MKPLRRGSDRGQVRSRSHGWSWLRVLATACLVIALSDWLPKSRKSKVEIDTPEVGTLLNFNSDKELNQHHKSKVETGWGHLRLPDHPVDPSDMIPEPSAVPLDFPEDMRGFPPLIYPSDLEEAKNPLA